MEIYAITDANGAIRYVGQSYNAAKRLSGHWRARFNKPQRLYQWLRTLDEPPSWHILAVVDDELANSTERRFIIGARVAFPDLNLNVRARGGWSPEQRAKLSRARLGHKVSPETAAKIGAANRGRKQPPEAVEANRQRAKALWADPEWRERQLTVHRTPEARARQAAAVTGTTHSDETRNLLSESKRAQWADPQYRKKTTEAHVGQKPTAKTLARRGAALTAAWERRRSGQAELHAFPNRFARLDPDALAIALQRVKEGMARAEIAAELDISLSTLYRALRLHRAANDADPVTQES